MKLFLILLFAAVPSLQAAGPVVKQLIIVDSASGKTLQSPLVYGTRCYYTATCNAVTRSVVFNFDGKLQTSTAPFHSVSGVPAVGNHTLIATPYAKTNGRRRAGLNLLVAFDVVAAPTPPPTATPTK